MKSAHLAAYKSFQKALIEARKARGLTQADLADLMGRPHSFVSKVEAGDRRLDVIEYVTWMKALEADPLVPISGLADDLERTRWRRFLGPEGR